MPTPSMTDPMTSAMKQFETMTKEFQATMPKELQGAADLMAHPAAAMAASTALGFGMASQAFGLWMGSMAGMAEATQRLFALDLADGDRSVDAFRETASPEVQAEAAMRTLVADVRSVTRTVAETAEKSVKETARRAVKSTEAVAEAVAPLAALLRPEAMAKPATPDDLKAIAGIGPKLEMVLNDLGIWTYGQVAALGEAQIGWLDERLGFKGRILRDDWVGQAKKLDETA